nr:hypothetical protein [Pseudoprimorskyibacter insulae]
MLRDGCQHVLDKAGVAILAKLDGGAFQDTASLRQGLTQLDMRLHVAGKAADIVDDNSVAAFGVEP